MECVSLINLGLLKMQIPALTVGVRSFTGLIISVNVQCSLCKTVTGFLGCKSTNDLKSSKSHLRLVEIGQL